jgi:DNA-binding MarR family transcriptional regulator
MTLSGRPLLSTGRDSSLFVGRESELAAVERGLGLGMNTAVFGPRGSGKTSLLAAIAYRNREKYNFVAGRTEGIVTAAELLDQMRGMEPMDPSIPEARRNQVRASAPVALSNLLRWKEAQELKDERPIVFVVDGLPVELGRALFGALRDELWATQMQWIVTAGVQAGSLLMRPPVDAFFESQVHLEPLTPSESRDLIRTRVPDMDPGAITRIAPAGGYPRAVLDLVRYAAQYPEADAEHDIRARDLVISKLEPSVRALIEELANGEPMSASDPELGARLALTRARISQMLTKLEGLGLVRRVTPKTSQPGRPKVYFQLVPPQEFHLPSDGKAAEEGE